MTVHQGPVVVLSARVASLLMRHGGVEGFRERNRGRDRELDEALEDMRVAAAWHRRGFVSATFAHLEDNNAELLGERQTVTSAEAASLLEVSEQAVRKAVRSERLPARKIGRQWQIALEDLAAYKARKDER